jgi:hypothetical protein
VNVKDLRALWLSPITVPRPSAWVWLALALLLTATNLVAPAPADAAMRKGPYLIYEGLNTEMRVLWQLTASEVCTIDWGIDETCSLGSAQTLEYGSDHQHTYVIPDLAPGTIYFYRVHESGGEHAGAFRAAPAEDATDLKFVAYGDTRSYPVIHDGVASCILARCAADPDLQTFILSVGDLVLDGDSEANWDTQFFSSLYPNLRALLSHFPYQAAMGNHEHTGAGFTKYFPYPFVARRYWSFDYGPAHFAIVDQYVPYGPGSNQLLWLENDLASTAKPWKFICLHEPGWSAGSGHPNNTSVQAYIQPLCEVYGVAILFAGHNHYYARAVVNGVQHVTAGGGGAPLYTPDLGYPNVVAGARAYGHCEIEIEGYHLAMRAVSAAGSLIDSLALSLAEAGASPERVGGPGRPILGAAFPNPARQATTLSLSLPVGAWVDVAVFDVTGRLVKNLLSEELESGDHKVPWDGCDQIGRRVSPGVYIARDKAAGAAAAAKIVVLD